MKKKICFVVQRYGLEVNGGAELEARELAEHLLKYYPDLHVLTTKAIDYMSWKNEYDADLETINGVTVHRFPVEKERNIASFNTINNRFLTGELTSSEELSWVKEQGPYVPSLLKYIQDHKEEYDAFLFFTYLYYPTVLGVKEAREKAITVPTAHNEPFLSMSIFDDVFISPKAILFNTDEERELIQNKYHNLYIPFEIGAAGVEIPSELNGERFKDAYHLDDYIVYVGRIDKGKNCDQLFNYFIEYKKRNKSDLKLVLMGKAAMDIPSRSDIVALGFVDDQDKFDGIHGAKALIMPSEYESLSFVVLEAMLAKTPVLVNGNCSVLKGHCIKSNGALYYMNYLEFEGELNYLLGHPEETTLLCNNAKVYAEKNYRWDTVVEKVSQLIESI